MDMSTSAADPCPCGSSELLKFCCQPYIDEQRKAPTAQALMRSRYTAYVFEKKSYLLATWHPSTVPLDLTFKGNQVSWTGLSIVSTQGGLEHDLSGSVEFVATFQAGNQSSKMREKSVFQKENGLWLYVNGEVERAPNKTNPTANKVGRNEPCPCGSKKKFKRCCGQ